VHARERRDELARLVVAAGPDLPRQVAPGDSFGEPRRRADGAEYGTPEKDPEHDQRSHERHDRPHEGKAIAGLCALHRFGGRPRAELRGSILDAVERIRERPVDPRHHLVARMRVELGVLEGLQAFAVLGTRGLVRGGELAQRRADFLVGRGGARLLRRFAHVLLAVLELLPVLVERGRVGSAKQDILPFLDLLLERERGAQHRLLGLEILAADAVELLDGAVHARERRERHRQDHGKAAGHEEEDFELQASNLHLSGWGCVFICERQNNVTFLAPRSSDKAPSAATSRSARMRRNAWSKLRVHSGEATQSTSGSNSTTVLSVTAVAVLKRWPERRRKDTSAMLSPAPRIARSVPPRVMRNWPRTTMKNV